MTTASAGRSELTSRVLVALAGIPVVLAAIYFGDAMLATLLAIMSALGAREFYNLSRATGADPLDTLGVPLAALIPIAVHAQILGLITIPLHTAPLLVLLLLAAATWMRGVPGKPLLAVGATVLGAVYTGGMLSYVYGLRYFVYAVGDIAGMLVALLPVVLTWASDTGAYFTGRTLGGPKLVPSISPGKTISGAIGGVVFTVIAAYILVHWLLRPYAQLAFSPLGLVTFAVVISVVAQLGDLVESLLKRSAGVKDSGTLLRGHGGVLDRLDSLFFVLPVAFVLYKVLLIPAPR